MIRRPGSLHPGDGRWRGHHAGRAARLRIEDKALKKILIGIGGLVVLVIAAALIAPSFVDWNQYKDQITAEAGRATGRDVTIGGDIQLSVLPSPVLVVNDLSIANIDGGSEPQMLRLQAAEVNIALWPLLTGRVEVRSVSLVEPDIILEILADGRRNWDFAVPEDRPNGAPGAVIDLPPRPDAPAEESPDQPDAERPAAAAPAAVQLDAISIERGRVLYRDATTGQEMVFSSVNADVSAGSLRGPLDARGSMEIEGVPLTFDVAIGAVETGEPFAVRADLGSDAGASRLRVRGLVEDWEAAPRFSGRIETAADDLAAAIQAVAVAPLPGFLAQPSTLDFDLVASQTEATVGAMTMRLGGTSAEGAAMMLFGDEPEVVAQLVAGRIDLDAWLAMPAVPGREPAAEAEEPAQTDAEAAAEAAANGDNADRSWPPSPADVKPQPGAEAPVAAAATLLPADLRAALALSVEAITYRDGVIREAAIAADAAGGTVTVTRAAALLPGGADANLTGVLGGTADDPRFDGRLQADAPDLRAVLEWLGLETDDVPNDGLRTLSLSTGVVATPASIRASDADVRVDGSRVQGDFGITFADRPRIDADLDIDRLNLDAYLPETAHEIEIPAPNLGAAREAAGQTSENADPRQRNNDETVAPMAQPAPVDADVKLRITELGWRNTAAKGVRIDGRLADGVLTLREARVDDFAGASATMSGTFRELETDPIMQGVEFQARAPNLSRLARSLDVMLPAGVPGDTAVAASGRVEGTTARPKVDVTVNALGAEVTVTGDLTLPAGDPLYDGRLRLVSDDIVGVLTRLGVDYRPSGRLGGTDVSAHVTLGGGKLSLSDLDGQLAGIAVGGSMDVDATGDRPVVTADLATGRVVIDDLLPAARSAGLDWRIVPASWMPLPSALEPPARAGMLLARVDPRWPDEPLALSALRDFDATLALRSESLVHSQYALEQVDASLAVASGVLTWERLNGTLFGGSVGSTGRLDAVDVPVIEATVQMEGVDLSRAPGAGISGGRLWFNADLGAEGRSPADLISALDGSGAITLRGLDPGFDATQVPVAGPIIAPVIELARGINRALGPLLGALSGRAGSGLADISAPFTVANGVVTFDPARLDGGLYQGQARGTADLPAWRLDMTGEISLAAGPLGDLLSGIRELPSRCDFTASGRLDSPDIRLDSGCIPAPGTGNGIGDLLERVPEELRRVIPGLDGSEEPARPSEPERVIRDLFRGLIDRR
ncbi:MAG: AsmA family protein [Rhodospirillales bacterium]|nr:MAG: AsmA family protein [Rhodospirillales bacterium]